MGRGAWENVAWHLEYVRELALGPLREQVPQLLDHGFGLRAKVARSVTWALLLLGLAFAVVRGRRLPGLPGSSFAWWFGGFALLHLLLMAVALPHFTQYGTWYFASEVTVVWLVVGMAGAAARGWWVVVPAAVTVLMSAGGLRTAWAVGDDGRVQVFREAGEWLRDHTDPGARIGALSAGVLGWFAEERHVVNLDGLMNTHAYLDDYLRTSRVHEYIDERGIEWFSDYQPLDAWQNGLTWFGSVPASRLMPLRYRRMSDRHAYIIWRVLPAGAAFEPLGREAPAGRDRYVELAVAAEVHGRFPRRARIACARDSRWAIGAGAGGRHVRSSKSRAASCATCWRRRPSCGRRSR